MSALLRRAAFALPLAVVLGVAGCTVGPDFQRPAAPDAATYGAHPSTTTAAAAHGAGGEAQHFTLGGDIPADWWTLFHSPALNTLIAHSLANNADLQAAQAALRVAHETTLAQRGVRYPTVAAGFSASRQQDPPGALAAVPSNNAFLYNLFTPQVSVSYAPDLFGLNRRTLESAQAQEQAVRFQTIATQVTLSTNVVLAAVQQAALRAQIDATQQLVAINTRMLQILREQLAKGYAGRLDVAAQEAQLAQVRATLPPLRKQLAQQDHLLAVLAGEFPAQSTVGDFTLSSLQLPQELPLSLPSVLVAQRPDVRQAQANLHAASAQIGVAIANRLPNIALTANAGRTALAIGQVFKTGTGFWSLGADITAPIFQGGALRHQERAAQAAYVQAAAQYRSTVLTAFQNVADTLVALEQDADGLQAAATAATAARVTLDLSQRQLRDGYAGYLTVLGAEQAYQQTQLALVQAQAERYGDTAALFQALGGGWWHRAESPRDEVPQVPPVAKAATRSDPRRVAAKPTGTQPAGPIQDTDEQ
ncbi:MAG TPA: efflux transporter outer membrane subunit [Rhodanobacter sp.]|nr:efflux transporter outer membrane subunit [Rhodanobacter sp.]